MTAYLDPLSDRFKRGIISGLKTSIGVLDALPEPVRALMVASPDVLREMVALPEIKVTLDAAAPTVLVACFPRSASTFTSEVICTMTGYRRANVSYARGLSDHDLYVPLVLRHLHQPIVAQHHLRGTGANADIINAFGIRTIVLVRDIFDALLSKFDAVRRAEAAKKEASPLRKALDGAAVPLDDETLMGTVIDRHLGWYLNFHMTWEFVMTTGRADALRLTYGDVTGDSLATFGKVGEFLGLGLSPEHVAEALEAVRRSGRHRLATGITGRGRAAMAPRHVALIEEAGERLRKQHPWLDLSPIGLG